MLGEENRAFQTENERLVEALEVENAETSEVRRQLAEALRERDELRQEKEKLQQLLNKTQREKALRGPEPPLTPPPVRSPSSAAAHRPY